MLPHLAVFGVSVPFIVALGFWNSRKNVFTPGALRFWGVCIFVTIEFIYIGVFA